MKNRFTQIEITPTGFKGIDNGTQFSANFSLFLIRNAWLKGCDFEDLADGFGKRLGTHGDWSGIRDSSPEAVNKMLERTLNFFFDRLIP